MLTLLQWPLLQRCANFGQVFCCVVERGMIGYAGVKIDVTTDVEVLMYAVRNA